MANHNQAAVAVNRYFDAALSPERLIETLGEALLREDAEFHSYQMLEAGARQYAELQPTRPREARNVLVGVARYLAAHSPTSRAMPETLTPLA